MTVHDIRQFDSDGIRRTAKHKYGLKEGIIRYGREPEQLYIERAERLYVYEVVDRIILLSEKKHRFHLEELAEKILENSQNERRRRFNDWLTKEDEYSFIDKIEIVSEKKDEKEVVEIIQINLVSSLYSAAEYYLSKIHKNPNDLSKNVVRMLAGRYPREWKYKLPQNIPEYNPKDILRLLAQLSDDKALISYFYFFYQISIKKDLDFDEVSQSLETLLRVSSNFHEVFSDLHSVFSIIHKSLSAASLSDICQLKHEIDNYFIAIPNPEQYMDILFRQHLELFNFLQKCSEASDLLDKLYFLEESGRNIRESEILVKNRFVEPFKTIYLNILNKWTDIIFEERKKLLNRVSLDVSLQTKKAIWKKELLVSLNVKNVGIATVENVEVVLHDSSDYVIAGQNNPVLRILPRNRDENIEFHINPLKKNSISLHFSVIPGTNDRTELSDTLIFIEQEEFISIPNPYNFTRPAEDEMFFDREDLFQWIENNMKKPTIYQNVLIMGQRRTGKTSFLKELVKRISPEHYCMFVDMEFYSTIKDIDCLFVVCEELHRDHFNTLPPPNPFEFTRKSYAAFGNYIRTLLENNTKKIIFIFDEFDKIESCIGEGLFRPGFLLFLRAFLQNTPRVTAIVGGKFDFNKLFSQEWREFFTIFNPKIIGVLDEESAAALVTQPLKGFLQYESYAVKKILDFSGRNPYYIQLICHTLITHLNKKNKNFADSEDVSTVVFNEAREMAEPVLALTWEEFEPEERDVLFALSRLEVQERQSINMEDIERFLREKNIKIKRWRLQSLLSDLTEKNILVKTGESPPFYDFAILLQGDWIAEHGEFTGG